MESVGENEDNMFCFALTLLPPGKVKVSEAGIKWYKSMVPINLAGMKKIWLQFVCNIQCYTFYNARQLAGRLVKHNILHRSIWYSYG